MTRMSTSLAHLAPVLLLFLVPRFDFDPPIARTEHARALRRYAAHVVWQALRRPSRQQLAALARALTRAGTMRALRGARG